jgi:hypothetical protein
MKYFYLYIILLFIFIVLVSYYKTIHAVKEGFYTNDKTFVLMGDSIFKNDSYVASGQSIGEILLERTNGQSVCYAVDHSKIVDIYSQLNKIPDDLNNNKTYVFLSAGGNDILTHYVDKENDITNTHILKKIFCSYKNLFKSIT